MPELPEVEVTRRSVATQIVGSMLVSVEARAKKLRWPISEDLLTVTEQAVREVSRRGKYLLIHLETGVILIHLGMSGSLLWMSEWKSPGLHDHVDLHFSAGLLRFRDPRRFGAVLWTEQSVDQHPLLMRLGVEPFSDEFHVEQLMAGCQRRNSPIKQVLLMGSVVVGVGNIYASEVLFGAGIDPLKPAKDLSFEKANLLVTEIRRVLNAAIQRGGSTLRNFHGLGGESGLAQNFCQVYGREGMPCTRCQTPIQRVVNAQRSTYYCPQCQI